VCLDINRPSHGRTLPFVSPFSSTTQKENDMLRHMATKPREVKWAISLMLAALAIGPITTAMDWSYLKSLGPIQRLVLNQVFTLLLLSYFIWKVSQGRNWARVTLLVLFLLGLPFYFFYVRAEFGRSAISAVLSILQTVIQGTGLLLTFVAPAKDWFKKPANVLNS
jgi:hypothetical protein